ncbi:MAG: hypothetical protein NW207_02600 [Cytophagales bacterium]|nr:hypothetical protein [Cytophagales bacterium]
MKADAQIRQQIFRKIQRMYANKLNDLNDYINKLEHPTDKSSNILSFAGSWVNIDKSAFAELTDNLISNRTRNSRRIDE